MCLKLNIWFSIIVSEKLMSSFLTNYSPIERVTDFNFWDSKLTNTWIGMHIYKNVPIKYLVLWESWIVLKRYLPTKILRVLYNSLILPHIQYVILSWGSKLSRLSKLQKRATRVITCSRFNAHTEPLFKSLKLLKLEDLLYLIVLKLYYKLCHGDLPVYITNLFTRIVPGSTHDYDLRPSGILKHPLSTLVLLSNAFDLCFQKL